ncbi:hypothetical protein AB0E69_19905 [Kribbella sp. NPDC026611]|uniref:hypothetical protein n=1 Tax=Kribbella sp. NPDC026611 TaxID=3154911 RepID=UPI0033F908F4
MGASGWDYVVAYDGDVAAALVECRTRTFADGDLYWDEDLGDKPATLAELDVLREDEEFWEVGTHSILDMDRVVGSDDEDYEAAVRELPEMVAREMFGTAAPSRAEFEAAGSGLPYPQRWSGYYQLLYTDGKPTEIAFWGVSGD